MGKRSIELYVGIFVIIGLICSTYLVTELGGLRTRDNYPVYAYFSSVAGLKKGANVEMAGVKIGTVTSVSLDPKRLLAKVELSINKDVKLSDDVIASVKTSGIIGDKYISLSPGASEENLAPGATIFNTEPAIDIEGLIKKYMFSKK